MLRSSKRLLKPISYDLDVSGSTGPAAARCRVEAGREIVRLTFVTRGMRDEHHEVIGELMPQADAIGRGFVIRGAGERRRVLNVIEGVIDLFVLIACAQGRGGLRQERPVRLAEHRLHRRARRRIPVGEREQRSTAETTSQIVVAVERAERVTNVAIRGRQQTKLLGDDVGAEIDRPGNC